MFNCRFNHLVFRQTYSDFRRFKIIWFSAISRLFNLSSDRTDYGFAKKPKADVPLLNNNFRFKAA